MTFIIYVITLLIIRYNFTNVSIYHKLQFDELFGTNFKNYKKKKL